MTWVHGRGRSTGVHCFGERVEEGITWNVEAKDGSDGIPPRVPAQRDPVIDFDPALVVRLAGDFDIAAVPELRTAFAIALEHPATVLLLDLRRVTFADASFVAVVEEAAPALRASGGALHIVNAPRPVAQVLRLCGVPHQPVVPMG